MTVNIAVEFFGKLKGIMDVFNPHIARPLEMGDATNQVAAQFHRFAQQLAPIGKRHDAILGEGDQLQVTNITYFFTYLKQCLQSGQVGITDIDMAAYVDSALRDLPANLLENALLNIFSS